MLASESGRVSYDTFEDQGRTTRSASVEFIRDEERDEETRKAVRKIDVAILPVMTIFYLLSFLVSRFYSAFNVTSASQGFLGSG